MKGMGKIKTSNSMQGSGQSDSQRQFPWLPKVWPFLFPYHLHLIDSNQWSMISSASKKVWYTIPSLSSPQYCFEPAYLVSSLSSLAFPSSCSVSPCFLVWWILRPFSQLLLKSQRKHQKISEACSASFTLFSSLGGSSVASSATWLFALIVTFSKSFFSKYRF